MFKACPAKTMRRVRLTSAPLRHWCKSSGALQIQAPTEELRTKYGALADGLEAEIKEVHDLRYQAGYHITDQS